MTLTHKKDWPTKWSQHYWLAWKERVTMCTQTISTLPPPFFINCGIAGENRPSGAKHKMSYLYHFVALTLLLLVALQSVFLFQSYKGKRVDH